MIHSCNVVIVIIIVIVIVVVIVVVIVIVIVVVVVVVVVVFVSVFVRLLFLSLFLLLLLLLLLLSLLSPLFSSSSSFQLFLRYHGCPNLCPSISHCLCLMLTVPCPLSCRACVTHSRLSDAHMKASPYAPRR